MKWNFILIFVFVCLLSGPDFVVAAAESTPVATQTTMKSLATQKRDFVHYAPPEDPEQDLHYRTLLKQAMEKTRNSNYAMFLKNPDRLEPQIIEGRFYRFQDNDGTVFRRADLKYIKGMTEFYVENKDGIFGQRGRIAAKLDDSVFLGMPEALALDMRKRDWALGRFSGTEVYENGVLFDRIEMRFAKADVEGYPLRILALEVEHEKREKICPMVRIFWVSREDGLIYGIQKFNSFDEEIFSYRFIPLSGDAYLNESFYAAPDALFLTKTLPHHAQLREEEYQSRINVTYAKFDTFERKAPGGQVHRILQHLFRNPQWAWIIGGTSACLLLAGLLFRYYQRRKQ